MTAATLSDLTASATGPTSMYADQDTPEGYFQVTTCVLGIVSTYLLKGELESADAEIVGRVELPKLKDIGKARPNGYKGGQPERRAALPLRKLQGSFRSHGLNPPQNARREAHQLLWWASLR